MNYQNGLLVLLLVIFAIHCAPDQEKKEMRSELFAKDHIEEPEVQQIPETLSIHGDTRIDPYYWLNQRENPEVIDYLKAENQYLDTMMAHTEELQDNLFEEIVGRIKKDESSAPYWDNGYYYYIRYEEGKEHPIYARKKGSLESEEEIMLNVNEMAEGHDYYQVTGVNVSPDNKWLAFGVDTLSRRIYTIHIKKLETGEVIQEQIENTTGGSVWANDNQTLFYSVKDETLRPFQIKKRLIGGDQESKVVYTEEDSTFLTYIFKTTSRQYLVIGSSSTMTTEHRILDANKPEGEFKVFTPRERGIEYNIDHLDDQFYVLTNWDAENFRLMTSSEESTNKSHWTELIPHRTDVLLQDFQPFKDFLAISERKEGLAKIRIRFSEDKDHYVDFDEDAYMASLSVNKNPDTSVVRIQYTSLATPNTYYDYDVNNEELELVKQQEVLGDFDPADYQTERIMVLARDGAKVPLSIVYKKGFERDGNSPLLLYAYGSYGHSMDPYFSSVRLSLLDRGFAFAIAHVRGGEEMGRRWYESGKLLNKKNTFTDFIDCADFLIENSYTGEEHLYAMGGSAGGLLIGAVINMRPELFRGVIAAVPFVDVVTTMLDESIPLTTGEYDEWGNPNEEEYYFYIKSYSPYDNVREQNYPATLVTTGLHDSQVQYWEPAKWVAKLRDHHTGDAPILLHTDLSTGHGGKAGRYERYKETAMEYAFFLDLEGITNSRK